MPSRQDQLHSYQFMVQRVVAAVVMRETDPAQSPFRRLAAATFAGVLVAALGVAGFAVWGLLQPGGSTKWRTGDSVIVEKETGATYVYLQGRLHPVVNYTSALLIVGRVGTVNVARRTLAGVPRGVPLGIPGAPDSLPARADLTTAPWSVCSRSAATASGGAALPRSLLMVGAGPAGGTPLGSARGLLVTTPDGGVYLVWNNHRLLVREPDVVLGILVWSTQKAVPVAAALVNALPAGADLARIAVPGRGRDFPGLSGARVGQVFVVADRQYAVALTDGLAPITPLQAALLLGDPQTAAVLNQTQPTPLSAGQYAALRKSELSGPTNAPRPDGVPELATVDPAAPVCAVVAGPDGITDVRTGARLAHLDAAAPTSGRGADGAVLADDVYLPNGGGAVVESLSAPGVVDGQLALVTDLRVRYPVPGAEVLATLGYANVAPIRLPAEIVALLPAGPALDPQAARVPALGG